MPQDDLFAGRWRAALDGVLRQPAPPETIALGGAGVAADRILALVEGRPVVSPARLSRPASSS
jgi:hypothetical protein